MNLFRFYPIAQGLCLSILLLFFINTQAQSPGKLTKQAEKHHIASQYVDAVWKLVTALNKKPDFDKAIAQMNRSFPAAVNQLEGEIASLKASSQTFSGPETVTMRENIVQLYEDLTKLTSAVKNLPQTRGKKSSQALDLNFSSYYSETAEARKQIDIANADAAEMFYERGKRLMASGGMENNKSAARAFTRAMEYQPGYKDANTLYVQARKAGTTRIAIFPFENLSGKEYFGAIGQIISDNVISSMFSNSASMEFVEIINRDQLELLLREQNLGADGRVSAGSAAQMGQVLGVHMIITGKVSQITTKIGQINKRSYQVTKNVVVRTEKYLNDKGKQRTRNIYGDVFANINRYEQAASATIRGSYQVINAETGRVLGSRTFNESYQYEHNWGTGTGNEKALGPTERSLLSRKQKDPPSDEEMVNLARRQVVNSVSQGVMSFVN